ncbi:MAG TPA: peptidoglycan DD-metalloendopeptidase family protein, partial [Jiangellaceae bacterium]|nr:peptidoglycan DD-metalloendopeptidase family protein [Jiangellaceae bacterium]
LPIWCRVLQRRTPRTFGCVVLSPTVRMFMLPGNSRVLTSALTIAVAVCVSVGVVTSADAEADVAEYSEAAKQAAKALDEAEVRVDQSTDELKEVQVHRRAAAKKLSAADSQFETARLQLERAQAALTTVREDLARAHGDVRSVDQDDGLVQVAAQAAAVVSGDSDNTLLTVVGGAVRAGLNGVFGPVIGLVKPVSDALNGNVDEARRAAAPAAAQENNLRLALVGASDEHRTASRTLAEAQQDVAAARVVFTKAEKAEAKAAKQHKEDAKSAKQAKAEAAEAEDAEKKARAKAEVAMARSKSEVSAARESAGSVSRSAGSAERARPGSGPITSRYGERTHPITGVRKLHSGTDYSYGDGNAYAASSGQVESVAYDGAYGNLVTVSHGGGVQTRYAHLARASVSVGERVSAGQVIGKIGSTGMSTGAHLHFEVLVGGDFVNPESWLSG